MSTSRASQTGRPEPRRAPAAALCAAAVGLVACAAVWLLTPYNDLVLNNPYVSDSYLPILALFLLLILVLAVNPLLRRRRPAWALSSGQLTLILGMLLVASVLPGQGLMRILPHAVARIPREVQNNAPLAEAYRAAGLPPSLFPDPLAFGAATPASESFFLALAPGQSLPWGNWVRPLLSWGAFLASAWLMMLGLSLIVFPQWRASERLPFPLLTVFQSITQEPAEGRALCGLFRSRPFWIAAGSVFVLHLLAGAHAYYPDAVPAVPLSFDIYSLFREEPFVHLPWWIYANRIYFTFIGAAFFMPNRIGFSIWFFTIAYALYRMLCTSYFPPYEDATVTDHRAGAMLALAAVVVWLGRARWAQVFRCLAGRCRTEEQRADRWAALMFVLGLAGMFCWLLWAGVDWYWALFFTALAFMATLLIARVVAETGMPFVRIDIGSSLGYMKMLPATCYGAASLWFAQVILVLFTFASRVNLAVMATHAVGLDEQAGARKRLRMAWLFMGLLAAGLAVAGASTLHACYHHAASLDGANAPLSPGGSTVFNQGSTDLALHHSTLQAGSARPLLDPSYNKVGHTVFGAALAGALYWACLAMPTWPLHPIGLLMVGSVYASIAWVSVFLGWLGKVLLVHFGGSRLYRSAQPFFIGLIVGEVFAAVAWFLVPVAMVLCGSTSYMKILVAPQ